MVKGGVWRNRWTKSQVQTTYRRDLAAVSIHNSRFFPDKLWHRILHYPVRVGFFSRFPLFSSFPLFLLSCFTKYIPNAPSMECPPSCYLNTTTTHYCRNYKTDSSSTAHSISLSTVWIAPHQLRQSIPRQIQRGIWSTFDQRNCNPKQLPS